MGKHEDKDDKGVVDDGAEPMSGDYADDDSESQERRRKRHRHRKRKKDKRRRKRSRRHDDDSDSSSSRSSRSEERRRRPKRKRRDDRDSDDSEDREKKHRKDRKKRRSHDDGYSSDSEDSRDHRRRKDKRKKSSRDYHSSDSDEEDRRRRRKHHKDKKKSSKKKDVDDGIPVFGKYGVLKASDFHAKQRSFTVWMEEVKGVLSFTGPKWELQEYFKDYMEDYNTATLPHIKYYDYDKWEMDEYEKNKSKALNASSSEPQRDEARHMQDLQQRAQEKRQKELDLVKTMMTKEKREEMLRKAKLQSEMAHAYKTGDQATYQRLKTRLEPER